MSFYIPFICDCQSNSDMYGALVDNREHLSNCIRYRTLAKNYFNPAQKWWRSSPFFSQSKLNSGARVLVENGEVLPAWRYSLLYNEREKWMRDYWLQSCRNLYYTIQSDDYLLPTSKTNTQDKSYCFVNGICSTLRSKELHGMEHMSMLDGFQIPKKLINSQYINTPLSEKVSRSVLRNGVSVQQFLEARNIFRSLVDGAILREILIYQGTTTSIPHSEMEQWMRILFFEDEILVSKNQRSNDIFWPVEAVNLFTRRQDIVENLREQSEDDLLELRDIARLIEKMTVVEIKAGDALIDEEFYTEEIQSLKDNFAPLKDFFRETSSLDETIQLCLDHIFSVQHINSLQSQVYLSSCFFLLSQTDISSLSTTTQEQLRLLNQFIAIVAEKIGPYIDSLKLLLEQHPDVDTFAFLNSTSSTTEEVCGVFRDSVNSHKSSSEDILDIPLSIQLEMGMGVLDFSQEELDFGMKKIAVGDSWEVTLSKQTPIRIRGEKQNAIYTEYFLVLGDDLSYKVEFKKQILELLQKKDADYVLPLEKGNWKISFDKQQLRFRIR
jgi:hypothetical protein